MTELKRKTIKTVAGDDAAPDKCVGDLQVRGIKINAGFTAYDPSKDESEYDRHWKTANRRAV